MKKLFLTTAIILGFAIGSNADDEAGLFLPGDGLHGIGGNADATDTYFDDTNWDWQSHIVIPEPTVAYDVTMKEGTLDAGKWEINPANAASGTEITLKYNGKKKVKNITIEKAAAAAPAIPVTEAGSNEWQFTMPDYAVVVNVEYETELELQEENVNTTVLADWDGYEADITLKRTLQAGGYNTLAVPFNMAIPEGWTVKELNTASIAGQVLTLNFADAMTIEAGKPYLVKVAAQTDLSQAAFAGAIVSKETQPYTSATVDFIPTLGATDIETDDVRKILFFGAENTLYRPESTSSRMKGFRAYFQLKEAAEVKGFELNFGDEATGIIEIQNSKFKNQDDDVIYNVAGQRLERTQKGINIVSGKKQIVK